MLVPEVRPATGGGPILSDDGLGLQWALIGFGVDLSARTKHGALLDAQLTAEIYLELIGGRQKGLMLAPVEIAAAQTVEIVRAARQRPLKLPPRITAAELEAHAAFIIKELGDKNLWAG